MPTPPAVLPGVERSEPQRDWDDGTRCGHGIGPWCGNDCPQCAGVWVSRIAVGDTDCDGGGECQVVLVDEQLGVYHDRLCGRGPDCSAAPLLLLALERVRVGLCLPLHHRT